jgi:hypothetical protein
MIKLHGAEIVLAQARTADTCRRIGVAGQSYYAQRFSSK